MDEAVEPPPAIDEYENWGRIKLEGVRVWSFNFANKCFCDKLNLVSYWTEQLVALDTFTLDCTSKCDEYKPDDAFFFLTAMKLLENSSFEALGSRLCVETGESRILGR